MRNFLTNTPAATVRSILDGAIESGLTTRKAVCAAVEADDDMMRRVLSGQPLKLDAFRRLLASPLVPAVVRDQLADWFARTTGYTMRRADECDRLQLDADGDGVVDAKDSAALAVCGIRKATDAVTGIIARGPGSMNDADKSRVREQLYEARRQFEVAIAAFDYSGPAGLRIGGSRVG